MSEQYECYGIEVHICSKWSSATGRPRSGVLMTNVSNAEVIADMQVIPGNEGQAIQAIIGSAA